MHSTVTVTEPETEPEAVVLTAPEPREASSHL